MRPAENRQRGGAATLRHRADVAKRNLLATTATDGHDEAYDDTVTPGEADGVSRRHVKRVRTPQSQDTPAFSPPSR